MPLGKLNNGQIILNQTDTESLTTIPSEYVDQGLEMALFFLSSDITYLEVYVLGANCTLCSVDAKVDEILSTLQVAQSTEFQDQLIQFVIDNFLPQLVNLLLPGIGSLLTPIIQNFLPGGNPPALPPASAQQQLLFRR